MLKFSDSDSRFQFNGKWKLIGDLPFKIGKLVKRDTICKNSSKVMVVGSQLPTYLLFIRRDTSLR